MKLLVKLATVSATGLLLSGCFSAHSLNRAALLPPEPVKEYVLSGDFLFDFDKSNLSTQGKRTLNTIAADVKESGANRVNITGYTDRLGSDSYNLKLSQARADAAKNYLRAQGVTVNIKAVGRGKANQVKACNGVSGQALISCLKPNRRVVIRAQ